MKTSIFNKKDILFVSPVAFNGLFQRHQGIALELAKKGYRVSFVNPLKSSGFGVSTEYKADLRIVSVKVPFKATSSPALHKYAVLLALKLIIKKLRLDVKNTVLWLGEPACAEMTTFDWAEIIYDCCDLHGAFPGQKFDVWQYYENRIVARADRIMVSHPYLGQHLANKAKGMIQLLPNATSYEKQRLGRKIKVGEKLKLISSGAHFEWIDMDWLKMVAGLEGVELLIAGVGRGKGFEELLKMENVTYYGKLAQQQLFDLMAGCHIGLIPFKNIELTKAVDPIKAYDYAALGLQVWAPDVSALKGNRYISCFISDVESAEKAVSSLKSIGFVEYVHIPTWSDRVNSL